jgi:TolB-like protein
VQRRLAAILVADVVGYSRLMEVDEASTLAVLRERRISILDPTVRENSGRIVKIMGDGALIEFASAINAVAAALQLQRRMAEANAHLPESHRIVLRIGINLGEVIGEGQDIYGDCVNIAARLEALAEPGGICISAKVHEEVAGKLECAFEDIGEQAVKNISRKVRAYRWRPDQVGARASPEGPDLTLPDKPSIAVLPFENMSADPDQEYFADGIVEDIITELSRAKWLFVIARNSSFTYKGRAVDIKQIGRELGVRYVLEGSVRKAAGKIRINGQLIDAATGAHLWADRFHGDVADVFDLQDQVTRSVVGAIAPRLEQAEIDRVKRKPTESLDAYDYYLRGMAAFHAFTRSANAEAVAHFSRALELDPGYAAASGMAARCYAQRKGFGWVVDHNKERAESQRLARIATTLGQDDAIALAAGGFALVMTGEVPDGDAFLDQALVVNPNLAWAWHISGFSKALSGQPEVAVERATHAMRLSPQDPQFFAMRAVVALGHYLAGRYDAAYPWAEAALREKSNFLIAAGTAAASAALTDRPHDAARAMDRLRHLSPELRLCNLGDWLAFQRPEDASAWADGLRKSGLPA